MLDVFGDLFLRCTTPRSAVAELDRYASVLTPGSRFHLVEQGPHSRLIHQTDFGNAQVTLVVSEVILSFIVRIARHFAPDGVGPVEVNFAYGAPAHAAAYFEAFGCPVHFDRPATEIVFPSSFLDESQPFDDEPLRKLLRDRAEELLARRVERRVVFTRALILLEQQEDLTDVTMGQVARRLGMSERRLRRRLHEEHASWISVIDAARRERAMRALKNPAIPIKQIAEQTGFSEPSAFHRAFRRWTGSTPARFRLEATGGDLPSTAAMNLHASSAE
jgi:AraC-like DNA-binding protein